MTADFFGAEGTEYDLPFAQVDAATIAIELDDFIGAIAQGRSPEVDGSAACWRWPASGRSPNRARRAAL